MIPTWIAQQGAFATTPVQKIQAMFANGEQGWFYDWQDPTTRFQDIAGATPALAAADLIGLHLDKSKALAIGPELRGTGAIGLVGTATAATYNTGTGVGTASLVDTANQSFVQFIGLGTDFCRVTIANTGGTVNVAVRQGNQTGTAWRVLTPGTSGTYYIAANSTITIGAGGGGSCSFTITSIQTIAGNHRFQNTPSSKGLLRLGAGGTWYAQADGVDDSLITTPVTWGSDKVTYFTAIRKLSDVDIGCPMEFSTNSTSNDGSFRFFAPAAAATDNVAFGSRGTSLRPVVVAPYPSPISLVVTAVADIPAPYEEVKINGAVAGSTTLSHGTGVYGTYPLYFWRRNVATLPFNGYEVASIGINRLCTPQEISMVESYLTSLLAGV